MMMLFTILLIIFLCCVTTMWLWCRRRHSYWKCNKVPHLKASPLHGNLKDLLFMRCSFGDLFHRIHQKAANLNQKVYGIYLFHTPALLIRDPVLIKEIFIKNANLFPNRYEAADPHHDLHGSLTLPLAKYHLWKDNRRNLTHLFTTSMLQEKMFLKIVEICQNLEGFIENKMAEKQSRVVIIEVKEMCNFYTVDVTASLMYSLKGSSLENGGSPLSREVENLLGYTFWKAFSFMTVFFLPQWTSLFRVKVFPKSYLKGMRVLLQKALQKREGPQKEDPDDLIDFLLKFQKESGESIHRTEEFLVSQVSIFLLAGFETSSSLIALILYELAKQPALQVTLRRELQNEKNSKDLNYLQVKSFIYLDLVVKEGLRLYPTASFINREYIPPQKTDHFSLKTDLDFEIPSGMPVYVSILGLHRDEKFWKHPDVFDPLRFAPENLSSITSSTYMPFGSGPHSCIGRRLGILQVKMALICIIRSYEVSLCPKTIPEITFDPKTFMLNAKEDIHLQFKRLYT